jgi:hypothetical protein
VDCRLLLEWEDFWYCLKNSRGALEENKLPGAAGPTRRSKTELRQRHSGFYGSTSKSNPYNHSDLSAHTSLLFNTVENRCVQTLYIIHINLLLLLGTIGPPIHSWLATSISSSLLA